MVQHRDHVVHVAPPTDEEHLLFPGPVLPVRVGVQVFTNLRQRFLWAVCVIVLSQDNDFVPCSVGNMLAGQTVRRQ